jgi:GDP-L-fucose synthase
MLPKIFDLAGKRIYVAGHRGMVGSAIVRRLADVPCEVITAGRADFDLERQEQAERFLATAKPVHAHANNTHPAEFIS